MENPAIGDQCGTARWGRPTSRRVPALSPLSRRGRGRNPIRGLAADPAGPHGSMLLSRRRSRWGDRRGGDRETAFPAQLGVLSVG